MNQFLKLVSKISIITFCIYIGAVCVFGYAYPKFYHKTHRNIPYRPSSYGHLKSRIADIPNFQNVDILVIGSSHAYRGFDPRIFEKHGLTLFNLGSSSQTPRQSYFLLKEYIDTIQPSMVIFEVYPRMFALEGVEAVTDLISNDNLSFSLVEHAILYGDIITLNTLIYRVFDELVLRNTYEEPVKRGNDTYVSGGYVETDTGFHRQVEITESKPFHFKDEQFKYFEKALSLLKARGISFVFIQTPVTSALAEVQKTPEVFIEKMKSLGVYIDYQKNSNYIDSIDFVDANHLSQHGVNIFNKLLIKDVFKD